MANTKHTPGPWLANSLTTGGTLKIKRGRTVVAEVPYRGSYTTWADARLISAAPDQHTANVATLDFLRRLRETEAVNHGAAHMVDELDALIEQNAAAIARATDGQERGNG